MNNDSTVVGIWWEKGISRQKASMTTKCIAQIPVTMETEPATSQTLDSNPDVFAILRTSVSAVKEATIAIMMGNVTRSGS
ncbi:MAG: hypothetical protein ACJA0Z_001374 [Halioglobus sp.]|jgi:hypothetical protein